MATATAEPKTKPGTGWSARGGSPPQADAPRAHALGGEAARKRKLAHAHVLAAAIFRHPDVCLALVGTNMQTLATFQRKVILSEAKNLGFEVESRSALTPVQLARVCTSLRRWMAEHGIAVPRKKRSGKQSLGEKIQIILDKAGQLGWSQATLDTFVARQAHNAPIDTHEKADAVLAGLNGILRHRDSHRDTETQGKD